MYYSRSSKKKVYHEDWCPYIPIKGKLRKSKVWVRTSLFEAEEVGYQPCRWCGGMHGLYLTLKEDPRFEELHLCFDRANDRICFRTDNGFWNVRKGDNGLFWLYHLNHRSFDPNAKDSELMKGKYHRQKDVKETDKLSFIMNYICEHDRMRQIMDKNWRNLPKTTKQKRKYYQQAKKRAKRKALRDLDKIFDQLEKEKEQKGA